MSASSDDTSPNSSPPPLIFHGTLIHTPDDTTTSSPTTTLEILPSTLLIVSATSGKITHLIPSLPPSSIPSTLSSLLNLPPGGSSKIIITHLSPSHREFLIPGFIDTHNHAPQHPTRGLGQGLHILDWLDRVTFPAEAKFADPAHARVMYDSCVASFLRQGITTASYYGSVHGCGGGGGGGGSFEALVDACLRRGQRALVGKCNMDREASEELMAASGGAGKEVEDTRRCMEYVREKKNKNKENGGDEDDDDGLVRYVVTPRFAICCSEELLKGLGGLVTEEDKKDGEGGGRGGTLMVQTHFNEAVQEMEYTKKLFPQFGNEVDLYEHYGLLRKRKGGGGGGEEGNKAKGNTILAHCCYMSEYEYQRFGELGCGVAHCPVSNMTVGGGFMAAPVREFLRRKINVGLGTDSGGGFSSSMLDAMRQAIVASNAREVMDAEKGKDSPGLSIDEVFHMATQGGANVCGLGDKVGSFEVGKEFDALVVRTTGRDGEGGVMTMVDEENDDMRTVFEKFVMTGDDRNIGEVYVRGRSVKV